MMCFPLQMKAVAKTLHDGSPALAFLPTWRNQILVIMARLAYQIRPCWTEVPANRNSTRLRM